MRASETIKSNEGDFKRPRSCGFLIVDDLFFLNTCRVFEKRLGYEIVSQNNSSNHTWIKIKNAITHRWVVSSVYLYKCIV